MNEMMNDDDDDVCGCIILSSLNCVLSLPWPLCHPENYRLNVRNSSKPGERAREGTNEWLTVALENVTANAAAWPVARV